MKKKIIIGLVIIFSILSVLSIKSNAAISVENKNVNIYQLNGYDSNKYSISIPDSYQTTYQIKINGTSEKAKYEVIEGTDIITVSDTGLITPIAKDQSYSSGTFKKYNFGTAVVKVTVGSSIFEITVKLNNYTYTYCDNIIQDYIDKNITNNMSELDKLKKICEFVASYDYGPGTSYVEMILSGDGDCWASSDCIVKMCNMLGLKSHFRNGIFDPGAGEGHQNVAVLIDGQLYIAEAGFAQKAPRYYEVSRQMHEFTYEVKDDDTIKILQYDGFDSNIVVPSEINGKKVTEIGDYAFYYGNLYVEDKVKTVTLPNTIEIIGDGAFLNCENITSFTIPENVELIGGRLFEGCTNFKNLTINSKKLVVENNIIYNKEKTILMTVMPNITKIETVTLPNTVKTINDYAFFEQDIDNIILNEGLTKIGVEAFRRSTIKGITIPKTVTNIEQWAFAQCNELGSVFIEDGCNAEINERAFYWNPKLYAAKIPSSETNINNKAFEDCVSLTIYGKSNSKAEEYAKNNGITFSNSTTIPLSNGMISMNSEEFTYNGKVQKPNILVYYGSEKLTNNKDYTLSFSNDLINAGTKDITIKGKGDYTGNISLSYKINKAKVEVDFEIKDVIYGEEELNPVITKNPYNVEVTFFYQKVGSSIASNSKPTEIGEYIVFPSLNSIKNYYIVYTEKKVNILKPVIPFTDVKTTDWFYGALKYTYQNGIIKGATDTEFRPSKNITRADLLTILWRMEGEPKVTGVKDFPDVSTKSYYANAVRWATKNNIVSGYKNGKFGPTDNITREQLATILYNYAKYKGKNVTANQDLSKYKDWHKVTGYAQPAIKWAIAKGVVNGKDNSTRLDPQGTATRAEATAMIYNYCTRIK